MPKIDEVNKITDQITHILYSDHRTMCDALLRFQEHYESPNPEFRGKVFTVGEHRDWYSRTRGGNVYERDWAGFNFPSYVLEPFKSGLFDPLTKDEQEVVELFRYRTDKFYVIGTCASDDQEDTLEHEICHGLFYTNDAYRKEVLRVLDKVDLRVLKSFLMKEGYCKEVLVDECHAYISASRNFFEDNELEFPESIHKALRKIKKKHFK